MAKLNQPLLGNDSFEVVVDPKASERTFWDRALSVPKEGSLRLTCLFLITSSVGASYLSLPYVTSQVGIFGTLFLFALAIWISHFSVTKIFDVSRKLNMDDYGDLARWYAGRRMEIFFQLMICFGISGILIIHIVASTDLFATFFYTEGFLDAIPSLENPFNSFRVWTISIISVFQFLFTLTGREASSLRYLGAATMVCFFYTILVILLQSPAYFSINWDSEKAVYFNIDWTFPVHLSVFTSSFAFGANAMPAKSHLYNPTKARLGKVSRYWLSTLSGIYIPLTIIAYCSLLDQTPALMINRPSLPSVAEWSIQLTRFALGITLCLTNVSLFVSLRISFENLIQLAFKTTITRQRERIFNFILFMILGCLSVVMNNVVSGIGLVGGLFQNFLGTIFPTLLYLKATKKPSSHPKVVYHLVSLIFFIWISIVSTYFNLKTLF